MMFGFNEFGETTLRDVKHSFVCSEHFTPNNYVITSLAETLCEHKGGRVYSDSMEFQQFLSFLKINLNLYYQAKEEVALEKRTR